jgi:TetR/AcrR family transcriptional regulator of autoinduction and epiphytic fitness
MAERPLSTFSESKRAAVLQAAAEAFLRSGFTLTSMDTIAEAAGVSKRTVYNHFQSKDALFDALIEEKWASLAPAAIVPPPHLSVETRLKNVARDRLRVLLSKESIGLFRIVFAESVTSPAMLRAYLGAGQHSDFLGMGKLLSEEVKRGRLQIDSPQTAATQFWGLVMNGTFWPLAIGLRSPPDETEIEIVIDEAVRTFLARFAKPKRSRK